nr:hypothetical protein [Prevotella sp.]
MRVSGLENASWEALSSMGLTVGFLLAVNSLNGLCDRCQDACCV